MAPSMIWLEIMAALYVLSGVCQPLMMTLLKNAGLANPTAQLYMVFYYLGPATLLLPAWKSDWPRRRTSYQAMAIASLDVLAQALNYTGAAWAGPTLFAIIYSSVTVWTALWARPVLGRKLTAGQWLAVCLVFGGLTLTAFDTVLTLGPQVVQGTVLIVIGSAIHAGSYVFSEVVLSGPHALTVEQNTGVQCWTATVLLLCWQGVYTLPQWDALLGQSLALHGTTLLAASGLLLAFAATNLCHAYAFFYTIKFYKGGSVMAGIFKGLQAVLVFGATQVAYCGRVGGAEMCFSRGKLVSLLTVVSGVVLFSYHTPPKQPPAAAMGSSKANCGGGGGSTTAGELAYLLQAQQTRLPNKEHPSPPPPTVVV